MMQAKFMCVLSAMTLAAGMAYGEYAFDTEGDKYAYEYPYYVAETGTADARLAEATIKYVADAETQATTIDYATFYAARTGTFFKTGTGELTIDTGLTNWIGNMHVMGGVMHVKHVDGFGLSSGSNTVYVHNGATLLNETPSGATKLNAGENAYYAKIYDYPCRRTIAFEGTGFNGMGGLRVMNDVAADTTWPLMCYLSLTGDGTL